MRNILVALSTLVVVASAGYIPGGINRFLYGPHAAHTVYAAAPAVYTAAPAFTVSAQHHVQDGIGGYNYGYADGHSTKQEVRNAFGITNGGYSYVDAEGHVQSVAYTADAVNGFRVAATNLPKAPEAAPAVAPEPVQETAEVAAARASHLEAVARAAEDAAAAAPEVSAAPEPVQETPEVAAARAAHAAAHEAANVRTVYTAVPSVLPVTSGFAYSTLAAAPYYGGYNVLSAPVAAPAAAPVVLTASGVPVDTPEVQAARAADVVAHLRAKAALLG